MSKRHSSDIAVKLGWELSRTSSGRVRMTCPHGCCVVMAK